MLPYVESMRLNLMPLYGTLRIQEMFPRVFDNGKKVWHIYIYIYIETTVVFHLAS